MIETVSSALVGLAVNLLSFITKKTVKGIKDLFSEDELNTLLNGAYSDFKESCVTHKTKKDEKILLAVFDEFFIDDRTVLEFRQVFDARGRDVDFNLLEEIFVGVCIKKQIEIETFNFFQAVSHVIAAVETLAQKEDTFREAFQAARLKTIQTYLQKRGTEPNFTFARFKYLAQLREHNNRLRFAGIPDPRDKKDIGLPSVFVMQRAVETVPEDHYRRLVLERGEEADFTGEELQLRRMMRVKTEETREPVKFDTVLNESDKRRFVVLGKPGSGKSTLLKYLMLEAARLHLEHHRETGMRLFPILVEIRKFENALSETNQPDYNILDFLYDSMRKHYNVTLPDNFFETYLESGCALLLFDGLDEVASESRRSEIQRMIGAFTTSFHAGNTVIVTSRIAGYSRARFSTTDYRHFTLEDFNDEEIGTFVRRWYLSRMTNPVEAETKAGELKAALDKKPRIKELAKNPLLLTIIGIIHRYEAQLPEDRLVLYDKAMEALLDTWDNVKDIIDEKFRPEDKRRFLEKTAFHLQSLEQGDEAGTVIEQEELYGILFPDFREIFDCDNRRAKALVDEFLEKIRLRAGLLVELAPGKYGFVHKTFQEYFAAKWIANEATLNYDLQIMTDYVDQFIGNAFWQETLLLALRALPVKQAQKVLDHILKSDPKEMEPYFYHNHYFVMKFIAEQGRWLNNRDFVEKQIYDFFHLSWNEGKDRSYYRNYTRGRFESWVSSANDSLTGSILYELLLVTSEDEKQDGSLRRYCAEAVGKLGVKDKAVVERLLSLAEDEKQDGSLRRYCVEAVGKLGVKDKAVELLLSLAEDEKQDGYLRSYCASAVGKLGVKDKTVVERLLVLAEDEKQEDLYLRHYCANAVWNLGVKDNAVKILLILIEDEKQAVVTRFFCAHTIGELGVKDKAVVERLLALAEDEKQMDLLRLCLIEVIGELGFKEKTVMERLLVLAESEKQDYEIRFTSIEAIEKLGVKEKAVVERLLVYVEDEKQDGSLRSSCAYAVGNLGVKDKAVVERLLSLAEDEKQPGDLRRSCAYAVGNLGVKDKAVEILTGLYLAQPDKYENEVRWIYDSLWQLTAV